MGKGASRSIAIAVLGNLGAPLAAFISAPILARVLGVDDRGEVAAINAPFLLAVSALTVGIPEAITFLVARGASRPLRVFAQGSGLLTALGVFGTAVLIGLVPFLLHGDIATTAAYVALALIPSLVVGGVRGFAAGLGLWNLISVERTLGAVGRLVGVSAFAFSGDLTIASAALIIAITTFAGGVAYLPLIWMKLPRLAGAQLEYGGPKQLLSFGSRLWFGSLAGILLSRLDQTLMIPLADSHQLGLYVVAVSVSEVTLVFNSAVRDVVFSEEAAGNDPLRLARAARISTLLTLLLALAVGLVTIWLLPPVFGEAFSSAIAIVEVLLLGVVLGNPGSVAGAGLSARGRPELRSYSLVVACVVNVALVVVLVPPYGAMGAAVATVVGNAVAGNMNVFWMNRVFGVPARAFLALGTSDATESFGLVRKLLR